MLIEYKVRKIDRYIVTRFETSDPNDDGMAKGGCSQIGEYDTAEVAHEIGYALCKAEHDRLGWPVGDERIQYPRHEGDGVPDETKMFVSRAIKEYDQGKVGA